MNHYLDTSALAAYYMAEQRSDSVQQFMSDVKGPTISPLVEVELYCAVSRKFRAGKLTSEEARVIYEQFQRHVAESRYQIVMLPSANFNQARDWIAELTTPLRVLDGLHMALCRAHKLCLTTADRELVKAAAHFGVKYKLLS